MTKHIPLEEHGKAVLPLPIPRPDPIHLIENTTVRVGDWETFRIHAQALAEDAGIGELVANGPLDVHQILDFALKVCWKYFGGHDDDAQRMRDVSAYFRKDEPLKGVCSIFNGGYALFFTMYAELYGEPGLAEKYAVVPIDCVASLELAPKRAHHERNVDITHKGLVLVSSEGYTPIDAYHTKTRRLKDFSTHRLPDAAASVFVYEKMGILHPADVGYDEDGVQQVYQIVFEALSRESDVLVQVGLLIEAFQFHRQAIRFLQNSRENVSRRGQIMNEVVESSNFLFLVTFFGVEFQDEDPAQKVIAMDTTIRERQDLIEAELERDKYSLLPRRVSMIGSFAETAQSLLSNRAVYLQWQEIETTMRGHVEHVFARVIEVATDGVDRGFSEEGVRALLALLYLTDWSLAVGYPLDTVNVDMSGVIEAISRVATATDIPMNVVVMKRIKTLHDDLENAPEWLKQLYAAMQDLAER